MEKIKEILHIKGKDKGGEHEQHSSQAKHHEEESDAGKSVGATEKSGTEIKDPREIEQPAKEAIEHYKEEHPGKKINLTTTSTSTRSTTKDVASTATINPFTETYTTNITIEKKDAEDEAES